MICRLKKIMWFWRSNLLCLRRIYGGRISGGLGASVPWWVACPILPRAFSRTAQTVERTAQYRTLQLRRKACERRRNPHRGNKSSGGRRARAGRRRRCLWWQCCRPPIGLYLWAYILRAQGSTHSAVFQCFPHLDSVSFAGEVVCTTECRCCVCWHWWPLHLFRVGSWWIRLQARSRHW